MRISLKALKLLLFKNGLGIALAGCNLSFYIFRYIDQYAHGEIYNHVHDGDCLTVEESKMLMVQVCYFPTPTEVFFALLNLPAILLTHFSGFILEEMFPQTCVFTISYIESALIWLFIPAQWLVIGYIATRISRRRSELR